MALTLDQIVERSAVATEEFEIPEWSDETGPGTVLLKGISKRDQQFIWNQAGANGGKVNSEDLDTTLLNKLLLQAGMVEPKVDDAAYEQLQDGYAGTLDRIVVKIMKLSKFSEDDLKQVQKSFPV